MPVKRLMESTFCMLEGGTLLADGHVWWGDRARGRRGRYGLRRRVWVELLAEFLECLSSDGIGRVLGPESYDGEAQLSGRSGLGHGSVVAREVGEMS